MSTRTKNRSADPDNAKLREVSDPPRDPEISGRPFSGRRMQSTPSGEAVRRLYDEGRTEREIAKLLGVSRRHVAEAMLGAGIERRRSGLQCPVSRDDLFSLSVGNGLSQSRLARMFGVSDATVGLWLAECGLGVPDPRIDHVRLRELYVGSQLTAREVAAAFGVSHHRVIRELALAGIARRARYERSPKGPRASLTAGTLRELYVLQGLSINAVAKHAGVGPEYVWDRIREYKLPRRRGNFKPRTPYTADQLCRVAAELYDGHGLTMRQVATELGVSSSRVRRALHEALIPVRRGGPPSIAGGQAPGQMVHDLYGDPAVVAALSKHEVVIPALDSWRPAGQFESFAPLPLSESLVRALYENLGLSMFHVSLLCGVSEMSVATSLQRYRVPLRQNGPPCPWYERTYMRDG